MTKMNEMWAALAAYQPQADAAGHGESWAAMCQLRTIDAAEAAASVADYAAYAADYADYAAYAAYAAANAVNAAHPTETWAQRAIDRISKVLKVAEPVALAEHIAKLQASDPLIAKGAMSGVVESQINAMYPTRSTQAAHIPDAGNMVEQPQQEPFGYFKAEPFGWTDCAETDDGAVALYEHPPAQRKALTMQDWPALSAAILRALEQIHPAEAIESKHEPQ